LKTIAPSTVAAIRKNIVVWFTRSSRDLPWRNKPTPYRVWVAEIMAQQTRMNTVLPYYRRFLRRFPTLKKLADAEIDEVLTLWSGLGYYRRARAMHQTARLVIKQHNGRMPADVDALRKLPGIGRYTAGAIVSIAFNRPAPILDGNVTRVLTRILDIDAPIEKSATKNQLWQIAEQLVPDDNPRAFNEGLMELGALVCTPRSPVCLECPLKRLCRARRMGTIGDRPVTTAPVAVPRVDLIGLVSFRCDGSLLLVQNEFDGLFGGLWQIPLLNRHKLPANYQSLKTIGSITHILTHRRLHIRLIRVPIKRNSRLLKSYRDVRWVRNNEVKEMALASLTQKVLRLIGFDDQAKP